MHGRAGLALRTPVLRHTAASAGEHHSPAAVPAPVPTPVPTPVLTCTAARSHQRSHICAHTSLLNCNPSLRPVAGDNNQTPLCPPEKAAEAWGLNRLNLHRPGPVPPPTPLPPPCSAPGLQEGLPAPLRLLGSPVLQPSPRARGVCSRIAQACPHPAPGPVRGRSTAQGSQPLPVASVEVSPQDRAQDPLRSGPDGRAWYPLLCQPLDAPSLPYSSEVSGGSVTRSGPRTLPRPVGLSPQATCTSLGWTSLHPRCVFWARKTPGCLLSGAETPGVSNGQQGPAEKGNGAGRAPAALGSTCDSPAPLGTREGGWARTRAR